MQSHPSLPPLAPLAALAAAGVAGIAGTILYGIHGRASQVFGRSIYRGPDEPRAIALTFDDGPNPGTLPLLDYLASENVAATFFQCGMNVQRHPAVARAVVEAGHQIGNHTRSHLRLCPRLGWKLNLQSPSTIYEELRSTQEILLAETGVRPSLFRAPYGMRWFGLAEAQRRLGLTGVMWTVIGHDWEWPSQRVTDHVLAGATPGGIVCLHDGRDIQPDPDLSGLLSSMRQIVPALKAAGYAFKTVDDLMRPGNHPK